MYCSVCNSVLYKEPFFKNFDWNICSENCFSQVSIAPKLNSIERFYDHLLNPSPDSIFIDDDNHLYFYVDSDSGIKVEEEDLGLPMEELFKLYEDEILELAEERIEANSLYFEFVPPFRYGQRESYYSLALGLGGPSIFINFFVDEDFECKEIDYAHSWTVEQTIKVKEGSPLFQLWERYNPSEHVY